MENTGGITAVRVVIPTEEPGWAMPTLPMPSKPPVFTAASQPLPQIQCLPSGAINNNRIAGRGGPATPGLPCNDDEEVQAVPCVSQVAFLPKNPQRNHLDDHFHGEEGKDEVIEALQKKGRGEGCSCVAAHSHRGRELET